MSGTLAAPYPLVGFRFNVQFLGNLYPMDIGFQEVSGLEMTMETEDLREGGDHAYMYRFPLRVKHQDLILKRGLLKHSALSLWVTEALENFRVTPLLATISLLDSDDTPMMVWQAHQAWPLSWSLGSLDASKGQVLIETMRLAYAYLRRLI